MRSLTYEEYQLMNKDRILADIRLYEDSVKIYSVYSKLPDCLANIQRWLDNRTSCMMRSNLLRLLDMAGIHNKSEYLKTSHAISLNDTFWVKQHSDDLTWNKINPYINKFSKVISEIALNCHYIGGDLKSPSPDYTIDGTADKCWRRINGNIYLYKTCGEYWGGRGAGLRPYCEYYANQVASAFIPENDMVKYGISVNKIKSGYLKPYCKCLIFTNEKSGFLPLGESSLAGRTLNDLDGCVIRSVEDRMLIREMILLDSLILNYDRHEWNYGFIIDNDTYEVRRMAPIFDQDNSLGNNVSTGCDTAQEFYEEAFKQYLPRTGMGGWIEQARWALTSSLANRLKNMYPFHFNRLPKEIDLPDERITYMEYIVNMQIRRILGRYTAGTCRIDGAG